MKASVIISDVNEQGLRLPVVQMLCNQDFDDYEVFLASANVFTPEHETMLKDFERQYPHFRMIHAPGGNRAEIINKAVKRAKGEILCFIESHCIAHRKWVKMYVDLFKSSKVQAAMGTVNTIPASTFMGKAQESKRLDVVDNLGKLGTVKSFFDFHNSAMRRNTFLELGGLSSYIPIMAEFELGARFRENGGVLHFLPKSVVWHANDSPFWKYGSVISQQGKEKALILRKHGREFIEKYFPAPTFLRLLPLLRFFRLPFMFLTKSLVLFGMFGFYIGKAVRSQHVCNFYFAMFAKNSFRFGLLRGLAG